MGGEGGKYRVQLALCHGNWGERIGDDRHINGFMEQGI
jgi:hypothetical protein